MSFAFHSALHIEALARSWEPGGRIHIADILAPETAERLEAALRAEGDWTRSVVARSGTFHAPLKDNQPQGDAHRKWLAEAQVDPDDPDMSYIYDNRPLGSGHRPAPPRGDLLDDFEHWLNDAAQMDVLRALTGQPARSVYAQATRFLPGHVLTEHSDLGRGNRLTALVFNLTRKWRADWGGLLLFHGPDGHVERGFTPDFNSLNLFTVPQNHSVSQVASFAKAPRLAISGWLLA